MKVLAAFLAVLAAVSAQDAAEIEKKVSENLGLDKDRLLKQYQHVVPDPWTNPVDPIPLDFTIPGTQIALKGKVNVESVKKLSSTVINELKMTDLSAAFNEVTGEANGKIHLNMTWTENVTAALLANLNVMGIEGDASAILYTEGLGVAAIVDVTLKVDNTLPQGYCLETVKTEEVMPTFTKVGTQDFQLLGKLVSLSTMVTPYLAQVDSAIAQNTEMINTEIGKQVRSKVDSFMQDYISSQKCKGGAGTKAEGNTEDISKSTAKYLEEQAGLDNTSASSSLVPSTVVALFVAACAILN